MKIININNEICDSLSNDNFRHIYKIYLEKDKKYFFHLQSTNECEFNLRIYDINKNIIKFRYDNHDENIFIADIKNDIEYSEIITSENEEVINYEDDSNYFSNDEGIELEIDLDDEIIQQSLFPSVNYNLESKIHETLSEALLSYNKVLNNEKKDNVLINYNNKQYFSPNDSNFYIIAVSSDYENNEGGYSLLVKEVEDISTSSDEEIWLNIEVNILLNSKFDSKKYFVNLEKNKNYEILSTENLTFLISKNDQKIISKVDKKTFKAEYDGSYNIEVISHIDNLNDNFSINTVSTNNDSNEFKVINATKIILQDENGNKFELCVKNNKLNLKSV